VGPLISGLHDSQHAKDQEQNMVVNLHLFLDIQFSTSGNSSITGKKINVDVREASGII